MNGAIIYRGPSELDGAPIVVIATGLAKSSRNGKTGNLIQTWIMRDDVSPADAIHTGDDSSICGACPHRGVIVDGKNLKRTCYVTIWQAPLNIWKSYHRGIYPDMTGDLDALGADRLIRLGAYGDPAAVPMHVWQRLLRNASGSTGYTHQWRTCDPDLAEYCMASADTADERWLARAMGYRVFRVRSIDDPVQKGEVVCPASAEAGKRTNCAACKACGGHKAKARADIVIAAHGSAAKVNAHTERFAA